MIVFLKRLFAFGTVAIAIAMLIGGAMLIRKNTPKTQGTEVRFSPPTLPNSSTHEPVSSTSNANKSDRGSETRFIGGIGLIEPAGEAIAIGSQIAGTVTSVHVQPGDSVEMGAPLFVIDDRSAQANLKVAQADLFAQQAKLSELKGQIVPTRARVDSAAAILDQAKASRVNAVQELARAEKVVGNGMSQEEFELRKLNSVLADARVKDAEAKLREFQGALDLLDGRDGAPTILVQEAAVEQAKVNVMKAKVDLQQRTVLAPLAATVLQVKIRGGEYAPSAVLATPLITLGVIDPLHVRVDIDESEIPRFHPTAQTFASVRGRPEVKVPLKYVRTEPYVVPKKTLSGGVSERVDTRVMQIIYSVSQKDIDALPGQQVDVYISEHLR
jgi:HlyD family secretion protein